MANGPMTEANLPNKKLDWEDSIYTDAAYKYPFLALLKRRRKPVQMDANWPVASVDDEDFNGIMDGADVEDFDNQSRDSLKTRCQELRATYKVTQQAELTKSWGVKDELKWQASQALLKLKLKMERAALSNIDTYKQAGADQPSQMRGLFRWLENAAGSINSEYPIGDDYRCSSDCEYTGVLSDFGEGDLDDMLIAAAQDINASVVWDAQLGIKLKDQMDSFTQYDGDASETNVSLRRFNQNASDKSSLRKVDFFEFSAGTVRAHVNYNLYRAQGTGAAQDESSRSGLFLNMDVLRAAFFKALNSQRLPNLGGGPRGYHQVIMAVINAMPKGQARAVISTDTSS